MEVDDDDMILIFSMFLYIVVSKLIDFVCAHTCLVIEATVEQPFIFAASYVSPPPSTYSYPRFRVSSFRKMLVT